MENDLKGASILDFLKKSGVEIDEFCTSKAEHFRAVEKMFSNSDSRFLFGRMRVGKSAEWVAIDWGQNPDQSMSTLFPINEP